MMDLDPSYFSGLFSKGIHPCAISGAWLTVVHGYCGITLKEDGIHWRKPHLPPHWNKIKFILKWRGIPIEFTYENKRFTAVLLKKEKSIPFIINQNKEVLVFGNEMVIKV
jgi:trehalose/maltose hydrolase-like predicted phosphorylase